VSIRSLLTQALGIDDAGAADLEPEQVRLRPSALSRSDREGLAEIVGTAYCGIDDRARLLRAGGKSTLDLLRRKDTGVQDAPDAVLLPGDEEMWPRFSDIARSTALRSSRSEGTSVVGGLDPIRGDFKAVISLDLRRLNQLHGLDEVSGEAELGAGLTGPDAERLLGDRGFSLGHFPQSFQFATIGGFAATRSSGQDSAGYGRFNDMVRGLRTVTPAGVLDLGRAPESAAGPDLRQLMIGSEGVFGIITRVRVR
jgi:alkyldihydroxyacetonephosphate synthase